MSSELAQGFALSPEQCRVWAQARAGVDDARAYRACAVFAAEGLSRERAADALAQAVRRHEILRTRIEPVPGLSLPVQVIAPPDEVQVELAELDALDDEHDAVDAVLAALRQAPPDSRLRAVWMPRGPRPLLGLALPGTCADRGTWRVLARELLAGDAEPVSLQYADIAAWLNEQSETHASASAPAPGRSDAAELPWRPAPNARFDPRSVSRGLSARVAQGLSACARDAGCGEAALYLACWLTWLGRLTGRDDVVAGVAAEARRFEELASALGPLTRILPVAAAVDLRRGLRALARDVQVGLGAAGLWETWCGALQPDPTRQPPAPPAVFEYEDDAPGTAARLPLLFHAAHAERFVLKLSATHGSHGARLSVHFDAACVELGEARRLLDHVAEALERAAGEPRRELPLAELTGISHAERQRLAVEWNRTRVEYGGSPSLHSRIAAQARRTPDAQAVVFEGRGLTYAELEHQAGRLAGRLRRSGVGPDVPVAVALERSLERIVAVLAVLKAGGAYVPLDLANPPERIAFMLAQSAAPLVLADARAVNQLSNAATPVVSLERLLQECRDEGEPAAPPPEHSDALAYVIYTSGSTGRPKGVAVSHAAIVNRILWGQDVYPLDAGDRVLQTAAFGFDFSVWEIFAPLVTGATLVLPAPEGQRDSTYLARLMAAEGVTTAHFVPSMLQVFLDEPGVRGATRLRRVFCGGEALSTPLAERFFERLPGVELFNQYGPTETTVDSTFHRCVPGERGATVPIGRPVANTSVHVLDARLELVPAGAVGELCLGGVGLARGYLGRPDLTAAAFVPDAHAIQAGARVYRTGDLARARPDGSLEFLGRRDQQVKVRGARIETAEIEALLSQHPALAEVAVVARPDASGELSLAAYVVCREEPRAGELREYVAARLPDYMVPASFTRLDALPRTPSGKLDRNRLPQPVRGEAHEQRPHVAPRDAREARLAELFAEVLQLPQIGVDEDFFRLGGHSLSAMRVVSRVRQAFEVELPLRALFEFPTVAGLSAALEREQRADLPPVTRVERGSSSLAALLHALAQADDLTAETRLVPSAQASLAPPEPPTTAEPAAVVAALSPRRRRVLLRWLDERGAEFGVLPLSFAQERLWFFEQLTPGTHAYNVPLALRLEGALDPHSLRRALEWLVERHEVLHSTYLALEGRPFQLVHGGAARPELNELDLRAEPDPRAAALRRATEEARRPFDLERGPLLRSVLLRLAPGEHVLVLVTHHVAFDGWSLGIVLDELAAAYRAFAAGARPALAELALQYGDFAVWQRRHLQGDRAARQLEYWRARLADVPPATALPTTPPGSAAPRFTGGRELLHLPGELSARVRALGLTLGATPFVLLLAGFVALVRRYTGADDVLVLSSVANRERVELERLVGFLINLVVLRTDVSGDPSFRELVGRVREAVLGAQAHQDVPFEQVVDALRPARVPGQAPFSRLAFTLQREAGGTLDFGDARVSAFELEAGSAKTDLTLYVVDSGDALLVSAEYNVDLFAAATVRRLLEHFEHLLGAATAEPEATLSRLPPEAGRDPLPLVPGEPDAPRGADELAARSNLTRAQMLFWLGQKLRPTSPIFNMVTTFAVDGRLDRAAFTRAVDAVVGASDALRTRVVELDGVPQQSVHEAPSEGCACVDLSRAADPDAALAEWVSAHSTRPLELATRPVETALLALASERHVFYLAHHHVIADGLSSALIWRRVAEVYEALVAGRAAQPELPAFAEFAREERQRRGTAREARAAEYWRAKLGEPLEPLPVYGRLPVAGAQAGRRVRRELGPERVLRLRELAARRELFVGTEDLTLLGVFAATLAAYLHQLSGTRRLSLGVVFHNRSTRRLAETIGMLIEILPVHVTVGAGETFVSLVRQVSRELLTCLKHGRHPIANRSHSKAWHALLNYLGRQPLSALGGAPARVEWVHTGHQDEHLAMHVHAGGSADDLVVDLDWDAALLDAAEAHQSAGHWLELLDAFLAAPEQPLERAGAAGREAQGASAWTDEIAFDF